MSLQVQLADHDSTRTGVAARLEEIITGGVAVRRFVENFHVLAAAAGGVQMLRSLVLDLAVQGRLTSPSLPQLASAPMDQSVPFSCPTNWSWTQLGRLTVRCDYGTSQKAHVEPRGVPVLRMNNIQAGRLDLASLKYFPVNTEGLSDLLLASGDLLFNRTNSFELVGKMAVFRESSQYTFASYLIRVRLRESIVPEYVNLYFGSSICRRTQIEPRITKQTNQANFNGTKLKEVLIPLPHAAEQTRIVAKVDELMALCDELEARQTKKRALGTRLTKSALEALTSAEGPEEFDAAWERVESQFSVLVSSSEHVAVLRGAIRGSACGGWLSARARRADWGGGEEDIATIGREREHERRRLIGQGVRPSSLPPMERAEFAREAVPYVPASWAVCGIDDILACVPNALKAGPFGSALTKSMYVPSGFKVYGQEQVIPGDHRVGSYYVDAAKYKALKTCAVAPGDMLISLMGTVGRVLILPADAEPGIINPRLLKLTLSSRVCAEYIKLYLEAPQARLFFDGTARGVAMDGLNITILRSLPIRLPPYAEQRWLVAKVDGLMALCDQLESRLRQSEGRAAKLVEAVVQEMVA